MPDPVTHDPPHRIDHALLTQRWSHLTFLHWPVSPSTVAPLLPAGTTPDVHEGTTWVGLVLFEISHTGVLGTSPLGRVLRFPETNVRLYARDATGRRGVVFRSMDVARLLPVVAAEVSRFLPYQWSRMSVERSAGRWSYSSTRRWPGPLGASCRVRVRVGPPTDGDHLAGFLTARWGLFSGWHAGRTVWIPVAHEPWPLHTAELVELEEDLLGSAGVPEAAGDPHVLCSPGVEARIGRPQLLRPERIRPERVRPGRSR